MEGLGLGLSGSGRDKWWALLNEPSGFTK